MKFQGQHCEPLEEEPVGRRNWTSVIAWISHLGAHYIFFNMLMCMTCGWADNQLLVLSSNELWTWMSIFEWLNVLYSIHFNTASFVLSKHHTRFLHPNSKQFLSNCNNSGNNGVLTSYLSPKTFRGSLRLPRSGLLISVYSTQILSSGII